MEVINLPEPNIITTKSSDYYKDLLGGIDMANNADTYVNIHRISSFDNVGITIPGQAHNWDYGCHII